MTKRHANGDIHEVRFGEVHIPFHLKRVDGQRLTIDVHPDLTVTVAAPLESPLEHVLDRVRRRATWIIRQQTQFDRYKPLPPERRYLSGETYRYLGRQYRLKVIEQAPIAAKLRGRYLWVSVKSAEDIASVRRQVDRWYRVHAREIFGRCLSVCLRSAKSLKLGTPAIEVRQMRTRWGSCGATGRIILNVELVRAPVQCVEYVLMHELCHLRVHDHSPQFFRLLSRAMPDWKSRKNRLDSSVW
ncbi:MAG: M48 family metallopeptidase [Dehalococcoidia bacterium]